MLTKEEVLKAFQNCDTVSDGTFHYWMNVSTGQISGSCSEGTCDFDYDDIDDFLAYTDIKKLEIR